MRPLLTAFREKLKELGWIEGVNLIMDVRATTGDEHQLTGGAETLTGLRPDVILAQGTPGVMAVRQNDKNVPVVFVLVADPAKAGLSRVWHIRAETRRESRTSNSRLEENGLICSDNSIRI